MKEEYKQLSCADIGMPCGFQVRAKTEGEIMELTKIHANRAHGMKEIWPETERKIKESIKPVSVDVPESSFKEDIHTSRQDFKFK
jgi:predicted small metal-binding protein